MTNYMCVTTKFYSHIYSEQKTICKNLGIDKGMLPLTDGEEVEYKNAKICPNCLNPFDQNWRKKLNVIVTPLANFWDQYTPNVIYNCSPEKVNGRCR